MIYLYDNPNDLLKKMECGIILSDEETAFPTYMVDQIMAITSARKWVILGGDILTNELQYTYDSWFYDVDPNISLYQNVFQSVQKCKQYLKEYESTHGSDYLIAFTISSTYTNGIV